MKFVRGTTGWITRTATEIAGGRDLNVLPQRVPETPLHRAEVEDDTAPGETVSAFCGVEVIVVDDDWQRGLGHCPGCISLSEAAQT